MSASNPRPELRSQPLPASHWWSTGMRGVTHALLTRVNLPPGPLLEIGCGNGAFLAELSALFPDRLIVGLDLQARPLALAQTPTQADLLRLPFSSASFAAIVALDSFDQQGVTLADALAESWRVLRPDGFLLLRLSAYPWLFGPHDRAFGTGRRYRASELRQAVAAAGLRLLCLTHANFLLLPPAVIMRLGQRLGLIPWKLEISDPLFLHIALGAALALEACWLRRHVLPAGLSLYALTQKPMAQASA